MPTNIRRDIFPSKALSEENKVFDPKTVPKEKIVLRRSIFFVVVSFVGVEFLFDSIYVLAKIFPISLHLSTHILNQLSPFYLTLFLLLNAVKLLFMIMIAIR